MKKITISIVLLFTAIFFVACSDDSSDSTPDSAGDYWPTSVGNNWVYTKDGTDASAKITGVQEIKGTKYYEFHQLPIFRTGIFNDGTILFIKKNKGDYYIKADEINKTYEGVTTKITGYEFPFFKDYLDVNQTWGGTYTFIETRSSSDPLVMETEVTYTGEILEKGVSLTVNGIVFNDVIKFRFSQIIDNKYDAWPTWDFTTDYWIAKGVGIIKFSTYGNNGEYKSHVIK